MYYKKELLTNSIFKKKLFSLSIVTVMLLTSMSVVFIETVKAAPPSPNFLGINPNENHVTIGDMFYTNILTNISWEIDNITISNITFLPAGNLYYLSTIQGNLFSGGTWNTPESNGVIDNSTGYAYPIVWINNTGENSTQSLIANISWYANNIGTANINIQGTTANNGGSNYTTIVQNGTIVVHPEGPSNFSAEAYNETQINITFDFGYGADRTIIVYKVGSPPSNISDGTPLCNITGNNFEHTDLGPNTHLYYGAFGWNATENLYSINPSVDHSTTKSSGGVTMVRGNVTDDSSNPLENVFLEMMKHGPGDWFENSSIMTSSNGKFAFNLSVENAGPGEYELMAMLDGYVGYSNWSISISEGETIWIDIELPKYFTNYSYIYGKVISNETSEILNNTEIIVLDTDFTHWMDEGQDKEYTNNQTYNNQSGYFAIPVSYKSTYSMIAFLDGYYAAFSSPPISVTQGNKIFWYNFSLLPALPDDMTMSVTFTDLDDAMVTVNRTIIAESPIIRFALDFMPETGNNNQVVSQSEVEDYLQMMGSFGPTVNVSLDDEPQEGKDEGPPDFLQIYVNLFLDGSNLDEYLTGTYGATLENIVNSSVTSTDSIYYNATFNLTLDGAILNQTGHLLNVSSDFKNLINNTITINFDRFYNVSSIQTNYTNNTIISTTNTVIINPGNGSTEELAYAVISLTLNGSTVILPIIETPSWHMKDRWLFNQTNIGGTEEIAYTIDGKPLRQWDSHQFMVGDKNLSYLSYEVRKENDSGHQVSFMTINDLDWIIMNEMGIDYIVNDIDFPLYANKMWSTKLWWGQQVNASVVSCSETKTTEYGDLSCVKINFTNSTGGVVAQEWYSPFVKFFVNRTRYGDSQNASYLNFVDYSLAPYIELVTIFANDTDDSDNLINSLDVNITINASKYSEGPSNFIIEGPLYKENEGWGLPEEITFAWDEDSLRDLSNTRQIKISYSGSLINASGVDGPYQGWLELRDKDEWGWGQTIDYTEFQTAEYLHTDFQSPAVSILNISDFGNDTNANNRYDYLTLNVTIRVLENGTYAIHGGLHKVIPHGHWDDWRWITGSGTEPMTLQENDVVTIPFNFNGYEIYESGYNSPYKFHLEIEDWTTYSRVIEKENETVNNYNYTDFETPAIYFNKTYMDQVGMNDYINSSTYLTINTSIYVEPGTFGGGTKTYDIHGGVHLSTNDSNEWGEFISGTGNDVTIGEGDNIVPLNFIISDIYEKVQEYNYNGSFIVGIGFSEKIDQWMGPDIDHTDYTTQNYSINDLPEPPISMDIFDDSIESGGDVLKISVYINISSNAYANETYDLHGGVHYSQNNEWSFITGMGNDTFLDYGSNTIILNFSGVEIASSGYDGPYEIWMGLDSLPYHDMVTWDEYTTAPYSATDFSSPGAQFDLQNITDQSLDFRNGSDYLTVELPVIVNEPDTYHIGGGIHWIKPMEHWEDWVFITGTGEEYTLDAGTHIISINFDQGMIREELENNNYEGILKVHAGLENTSNWQHIAHVEYETNPYSYSDFSASGVVIESATETLIGGDLVINLTLNVSEPDTYDIHGGLHWIDYSDGWENWWFITGVGDNNVALVNGTNYKELTFNGGEIYSSGQSGPYKIWVGVENKTTYKQLAHKEIATSSYDYTEFSAPEVRIIRENMTAGSVDFMNESYMTINVSLNASSAGTYHLDGGLHYTIDHGDWEEWQYITGTGQDITIQSGDVGNIIIFALNFNAGEIYTSGQDGPYKVWIGVRNTTTWNDIDHYEYATQGYIASEAPAPPIQFETLLDGQCDYINSSFFTINVTLNVSDESYAGSYDLHGGVHYIDSNDWWYHITGTGNWIELVNGTNNEVINFNAGEIKTGLPDGYNDNLTVWIGLSEIDTWNEITNTEYTAQVYQKSDFPAPGVTVTAQDDYVNDSYLTINLSVDVQSGYAGEYDIHGGIHWIDRSFGWEDWRFITGTGNPVNLVEGSQNVSLNFNGGEIYSVLLQEGYNDKLTSWIGIENMTTHYHVANTDYETTTSYSYNSFSPPQLSINATNDYINGSYLTVNVTINATGDSLNEEYDIHAGIHWKQGWEWRYITGTGKTVNVTQNMTIPINFNGGAIRASEHDGPYELWIGISQVGNWEDISHDEYSTDSYVYTDFAPPSIRIIQNSITDYANGTDYLTINVTINASQTGVFFLEGGLHWRTGYQWNWMTWAGEDITITSTGEQTIPLNFDGKQIAYAENDGWSGGQIVAWLSIMNTTTWHEISHIDEYETSISYYPTDFSVSPISFNGSITDSGVNISGGGTPYTHLNITVPLNVTTSGNYTIFAGLFDALNNTMIISMSKDIDDSLDNVTLNFTGTKIYKKHYNGTFEFKAKIFDVDNKFECDKMINTTNSYDYTDFTVGTQEATITGNYSNFTNLDGDLIVNVTINIARNNTRFELYGDLFDNSSTIYITNARNDSYFNNQTGEVVVQLLFNGTDITNSLVSPPYKLAYLRLSVRNEADSVWEELEVDINPYTNIDSGG